MEKGAIVNRSNWGRTRQDNHGINLVIRTAKKNFRDEFPDGRKGRGKKFCENKKVKQSPRQYKKRRKILSLFSLNKAVLKSFWSKKRRLNYVSHTKMNLKSSFHYTSEWDYYSESYSWSRWLYSVYPPKKSKIKCRFDLDSVILAIAFRREGSRGRRRVLNVTMPNNPCNEEY